MGTISSGTGLVSGLDIDNIVNQLMQLEARPRQQVEARVEQLETKKEALLDVNSSVLGIRTAADTLAMPATFDTKKAGSSNESVLTAEARRQAPPGTYTFVVDRLVSSHQMISGRGYPDSDTTAVGAGTLSFSPEAARLAHDVHLSNLNGGDGVDRGKIAITDRSGATATIDLSRAVTLDEVLDAINSHGGVGVHASLDGDRLRLADTTGQTAQDLSVAEVAGRNTAAGLGILGQSGGEDALVGSNINRITENAQLATLNDRNGVGIRGHGENDLRIELGGQGFNVSLDGATNLGHVLETINDHADNPGVTASIADDGVSLELSGGGAISVTALNGSSAAADLGILGEGTNTLQGQRLVAALNSRLLSNLNGGAGIETFGSIDITNRAGQTTTVDLADARSVSDVIAAINDAGAGVTAGLNAAGNGLTLTDQSGGTGNLHIEDVDGTVAADLRLATQAGGHEAATLDTGSLDYRYVSDGTRLSDLNGGRGVTAGQFTITDSAGVSATVSVNDGKTTVRDVIAEINSRPTSITASINSRGDGLLLTDTAGGALPMTVAEAGSRTAADLGIRGEATEGEDFIEGTFRRTVEIEEGDTLKDVADRINAAGIFVTAGVVDDGSSDNSHRLTLSSRHSGAAGQMVFDDGGLGFNAVTLSEGRDAVAFYGSADPAQGLMLTSRNNSLDNVLPGVSIDLHAASNEPVQLTISRDDDQLVEEIEQFVSAFNATIEKFDEYDFYDAETQERGVLLGDPTLAQVGRRLFNMISSTVEGVEGQFTHLSQVGLRIGEGGKLDFDTDRLREALSADHEAVKNLFTASTTRTPEPPDLPPGVTVPEQPTVLEPIGFARRMAALGADLTNSIDGTITMRTRTIDSDVELANNRIEHLNRLLESKRQRLEQQFIGMERALAQMQSQQDSLSQLAGVAMQAGNQGG